ncbi:MAG: GH1 family beta-glucosidase [Defluviicoccus sp.]
MTDDSASFPADFLWGAATSAYQIEGSPLEDGAGPSNWHRFTHRSVTVANGDTGDLACDHYHRADDDIRLMRDIGLRAYRFSVSWSRVLPRGRGAVNQRGLDFYRRLVDRLLEHDIQPMATVHHWDLPAELDDAGGWLNPDMVEWFADYAEVLFRALDDRVPLWITVNEPWVIVDAGYMHDCHPPQRSNPREALAAGRTLLRAHAAAVRRYRGVGRNCIGITVNLIPQFPFTTNEADLAATRRSDAYINRHYLDPIFFGTYPNDLRDAFGPAWIDPTAAEAEGVREPVDFLGINYYSRAVTRFDPMVEPLGAAAVVQTGAPHTEMGWEIYPDGLRDILVWVRCRYGEVPLYITENGAAFADPAPAGGRVDDPLRVDYLRSHLLAARAAIGAGVNLRGYFVWSLLDNFEWNCGYDKRFGIVQVDRATLRRTPKTSTDFYAEVIRSNGANLTR